MPLPSVSFHEGSLTVLATASKLGQNSGQWQENSFDDLVVHPNHLQSVTRARTSTKGVSTMEAVILDDIPVQLPVESLFKQLRVSQDSPHAAALRELIQKADSIARPKAVCGVAYIDDRGEDFVVIDGVRFSSRVLAVNLQEANRTFPYVATCGVELEGWAKGIDDILQDYWADQISQAAVRIARAAVVDYLQDRYQPGELSRMSPGSLADWPIEEQQPLFQLLGDTENTIGVRLTDSMLMVPTKSVSGIHFASTGSYENCMLCPRASCPNRRAPYNPTLYDTRYRQRPG